MEKWGLDRDLSGGCIRGGREIRGRGRAGEGAEGVNGAIEMTAWIGK